jgi:hypothetical protein
VEIAETFIQDFELESWVHVRTVAYAYQHVIPIETSVKYIDFTRHQGIKQIIEDEVSTRYGKPMTLDMALLFKSKPQAMPIIHHDVMNDNLSEVALNVPIYGCEGAKMQWFDGDYDAYVMYTDSTKTVKHVDLTWKSRPQLLFETEIVRPCLVNIAKPHRAINPTDHERMMMSLRFNPGLEFISLG